MDNCAPVLTNVTLIDTVPMPELLGVYAIATAPAPVLTGVEVIACEDKINE